MQAFENKLMAAASASIIKSKVPAADAAGFIEILLLLLPVFIDLIASCNDDPESIAKKAADPSFGIRVLLRFKIRAQVPGLDDDSEKAREVLFKAVLAAGKQITPDDVKALSA